jgi:hypothetical protein
MTRRPGQMGSSAGRAGLIAIGASIALTFAVAVSGPSIMEPALPGRPGQPPWALDAHLSPYLAVALTAAGLAAGTLGLVLVWRAIRGGWSVPARAVLTAGLLAAAALTLVPPFGSSDQLSYAAYGRMLVTGHNPYTTTPAQLAALGDPVARSVQDWFTTPSVYGPLATAVQGLASLVGETSVRLTVFVLGLANLAAFAVTALLLHRMTRGDPVRQLRAALLWACNPLLLQLVVAGAHVDIQAVVFAVAAVAVMFAPWPGGHGAAGSPTQGESGGMGSPSSGGGPGGRLSRGGSGGMGSPGSGGGPGGRLSRGGSGGMGPPGSGVIPGGRPPGASNCMAAGVLVGLGFAVKVSDVLVGLGLAVALVLLLWPAWRRFLPLLAALGAGFAVTAGAAVVIGGTPMLRQLSRESDMVSIGSPWRVIRTVIHLVVGGTAATDVVKAGAAVLALVLAVLLIRGLPGVLAGRAVGADRVAGGGASGGAYAAAGAGVAFALVLAWLFAWPYVLPWYDALAWALLPLVPLGMTAGVSVLDGIFWLLLARTAALGFGYLPARETGVTMPAGLSWLQPVVRHGVTPAVLAAATVWLVVLMMRSRSSPLPDSMTSEARDSSPVKPQAPGRRAFWRASGTTTPGPGGPQRCPGAEDTPPASSSDAPPARPSEAPARGPGR